MVVQLVSVDKAKEIKGVLYNGCIIIGKFLTGTEEQNNINNQLLVAAGKGFDSCIITNNGIFATRKLSP